MSNLHIAKPTVFIRRLMWAQEHRCFLCDGLMVLGRKKGEPQGECATREHVFPHATTGKAMVYNIVLTHVRCNQGRKAQQPSASQIAKAANIYKRLGITPFIPAKVYPGSLGGRTAEERAGDA